MKNLSLFLLAGLVASCTSTPNTSSNSEAATIQASVNNRLLDRANHAEQLVSLAEEKIALAQEEVQKALTSGDSSLEVLSKKAWAERAQLHLEMVREDIQLCRETAK